MKKSALLMVLISMLFAASTSFAYDHYRNYDSGGYGDYGNYDRYDARPRYRHSHHGGHHHGRHYSAGEVLGTALLAGVVVGVANGLSQPREVVVVERPSFPPPPPPQQRLVLTELPPPDWSEVKVSDTGRQWSNSRYNTCRVWGVKRIVAGIDDSGVRSYAWDQVSQEAPCYWN